MLSKIQDDVYPNFRKPFSRNVSFHSTLLPEFSRIFGWMVRFSRIHQFPEFLETFPVNFCTIIAVGSKFSKVLVELEASIISESINFYQKTSSGMNRSVCAKRSDCHSKIFHRNYLQRNVPFTFWKWFVNSTQPKVCSSTFEFRELVKTVRNFGRISKCELLAGVLGYFSKVETGRPYYGWNSHFDNEIGFSQEFLLKNHLFLSCHLGFDWSGWAVLIKRLIIIATGMVWAVSSDICVRICGVFYFC